MGIPNLGGIPQRIDRHMPDGASMANAYETNSSSSYQGDGSVARKEKLIESDPAWGQIVCRCETVPEAEIVAAIRRRPGAVSVEGVKRRCRAGMGRCQSGFCQSRVVAILARELGCDPSEVLLEDAGSWLVEGPLKGVR